MLYACAYLVNIKFNCSVRIYTAESFTMVTLRMSASERLGLQSKER